MNLTTDAATSRDFSAHLEGCYVRFVNAALLPPCPVLSNFRNLQTTEARQPKILKAFYGADNTNFTPERTARCSVAVQSGMAMSCRACIVTVFGP